MPRKPKTYQDDPQAKKVGKAKQKLQDDVTDAYEGGDDMPHNYAYWNLEFTRYGKVFDPWSQKVDKLLEKYAGSDANITNPTAKFNIFFSVVQTLIPAIFARVPRPDVSRRFKDNDPAARVASLLLERALEYELDQFGDYKSAMHNAVFDYLTAGRSTAWVRYEPHIKAKEMGEPTDGLEVSEDIDEPQEEMISEQSPIDYVHWRELGYTASARTWEEVKAVWRQVYLGRSQLVERFGEEVGRKIPLDVVPDSKKQQINRLDTRDQNSSQACIYEVWCKETKTVYWISKSLGRIIDKKDDPLGLEGFFPCPQPLFFSKLTDSLLPNPMYVQIQDQCEACDILAERQRSLIEALKIRGVYNAEFPELQRLFSEGENNSLIPVSDWAALAEKQGLNGAIDLVDITPIASTLVASFDAMEAMKNQVYDLSGVSDVMRGGGTDPMETATAQALKSVNGQNRLKTMQHAVACFAGDLLKLKAQMICNQYSDETILLNGGAQLLSPQDQALVPQALQMLRDEPMRGFRIQVTADSLILMDEQQEKQDRMEFINAVGGYFAQAIPMVSQTPELMPLAIELLKFSASAFKAGKTVEGLLDQTADSFREQFEKTKDQPKPPPVEIQKLQMQLQADSQLEQAKMAAQQQLEQAKAQAKQMEMAAQLEFDKQKATIDAEVERQKQLFQAEQEKERLQMEDEKNQRELAAKMKLEQQKMLIDRNTRLMELHYKNAGSLSVEQVKTGFSDGTEDETRELALAEAANANPMQSAMDAMGGANEQIAALLQQVMDHHSAPKRLVRDEMGNVIGAEIVAPQTSPIPPNDKIALAQRLPDHHPGAAIANKAIDGAGNVAGVLMAMLENMKKPKRVIRDEQNRIIGAE